MTKRNEPMQDDYPGEDLENCPVCSGDIDQALFPFCSAACHTEYVETTRREDEAQAANYL